MKKTKDSTTKFEITLPMCPTDNHLYLMRGHMKFMIKEGKLWKGQAQVEAKSIWGEKKLLEGELIADITYYINRDRDVHGSGKLILDSFQGVVYNDDKQFTHVSFHKIKDKENTRVVIKVEKL